MRFLSSHNRSESGRPCYAKTKDGLSTAPTVSMTNTPDHIEIVTSVQRGRRWTAAEKMRLVEATFALGMTVSLGSAL
jgi:hypothetical protein